MANLENAEVEMLAKLYGVDGWMAQKVFEPTWLVKELMSGLTSMEM